jgi:aspartate/methionine/tyrosine aminotransferase
LWSSPIATIFPARRAVYADLAFDGGPAIAAGYPDAPVITFSSLSKAYPAPAGVPAGWP